MAKIAFAWPQLPVYAARSIRALVERSTAPITIVATRPTVPFEGIEAAIGQSVHWVAADHSNLSWQELGEDVPDLLFCGGYITPAFLPLIKDVRAAGGRVVLMSDNCWKGGLKGSILGPLRHRLMFRSQFDHIFVPGASGYKVARSWGYSSEDITTGLYGADPQLYRSALALDKRDKTLLFVGQFVDRKNVVGLSQAFVRFAERNPDWNLSICGNGPLHDAIAEHPRITVFGFVQPQELAGLLRSARCLVLPSLEDHWPLVVHEAGLSGCALALSQNIGSVPELTNSENAVLFAPGSEDAIFNALSELGQWSDDQWRAAGHTSLELAHHFGPQKFADKVFEIKRALASKTAS